MDRITTPEIVTAQPPAPRADAPRMQYRSRPVSVAVDPVSLVIAECISITSAVQKHARSPHSSVSAILGGNPNPVQLGPPSLAHKTRSKSPLSNTVSESDESAAINNRWGLRGQKGKSMQDNPMISGFGGLRHEIAGVKDIHTFDAPTLLAPFLLVIQSKGTAAPITILALGALRKFLAYGFVSSESPRFALAMQSLSAAVTHCQFDISDSAQGEVVLLMILNLMEDMMSGPGGDILSDESVCDMMGRGLAICSQPRFSPVLRRTAEAVMVRMCQIIFEDVKHLEVEGGDDQTNLDRLVEEEMGTVRMATPTATTVPGTSSTRNSTDEAAGSSSTETERNSQDKLLEGEAVPGRMSEDGAVTSADSLDLKPYSLPSVRELFRVLVNFLDPSDRSHTDTMRVIALRIIHVALEVSGPFIARHPALATIAEDRLCCYLFQLVRSDNMAILQESLIVAGTLLATCREVLKLQQELFLSYLVACLHPTVPIPREPGIDPSLYAGIPETPKLVKPPSSQGNSGRSTPVPVKDRQKLGLEGDARKPDARQAMVETIGVLSRMPTFVTELFVNYDCDEDRADLCEDMIGLLSRNALPDSATWSTTSVPPLCLDALLRFIQFLAERLHDWPATDGLPDAAHLRERRRRKKIIIKGTSKFNEKPKVGLGYLQENGIIADANDPVLVAKFLKGTSRVSKAVLGDFLSKKGNEAFLNAFLDLFDFSGKRVDQALRGLLESFRLPGEAPLIAAIVESFAEKYCSCNTPDEVANTDAVFILTYAIILLNTDQHNPTVKDTSRMTYEDFARNLRGQNNGNNFSPEFLKVIYDTIKSDEIILPDEHDNKHAFDYAWRELLLKSETAGNLILCNVNSYDSDMFAATWRPIVSTLSYVFMSATDDAVFARIVTGFDECARIARKYGNTEALDQIVYCLSHITTLASVMPLNTSLNTEVQAGDSSVMVSELAVKLGRDFRAQLATLVLFRVVTGNEALMEQSWKHIIQIWLNLFVNSLGPPFSSTSLPTLKIPPIPLQTPSQVIDRVARSAETGFFSAFTSYISSYAADDPPEPSDEELESTLCTVDCIKSCNMEDVFNHINTLPASRVGVIVQTLLDRLPEDDHPAVISVKKENVPGPSSNRREASLRPSSYDPTVPFILEFCTILTIRDADCVASMGKKVLHVLHGILRDASQWHAIVVSRAAFYALTILMASYDHDFINVPILLHTISSIPQDILMRTSDNILAGLAACTDEPGPLRSEMMTSPDFWVILRVLAGDSEAAPTVFEILEKSTTGTPPAIIADNYEAAVLLLNHFASAAVSQALASHKGPPEPTRESSGDKQVVARGCQAVTTLHGMTSRIPHLMQQSHLESSEAWVFLQYMVLLSEWDGMLDLWIKIIEIMDRLMNSGQGDSLEEAVRENLKNVVLFMASSGFLVSPQKDPSKAELWNETWKRVDRFLPDLRSDLDSEEAAQEEAKPEAGTATRTRPQEDVAAS
ncbi:Uncharacterized protein ESCO_006797 [Escovopsis weberi]|uniref:SEC7 domain-containing protein n=1 Tax=Escovopsis weberi TaxID=150374 RepID=A0A0M8N5Y3_ESCWE|nr:Uncharacterized protein ESCO_006797 [Escovopsis weberi]